MNRIVAFGIIFTLVLDLIVAFVIAPLNPDMGNGLYTLCGLGFFVFGIWASVLLLKK